MKILIISHTSLSTHNNMGKTLLSLFSDFSKEELCHFYVYPMIPDVDKCVSHYRVTDKAVLKSYFRFKVKGEKITEDVIDTNRHELFQNSSDEKLYRNKKNKSPSRILLRDWMWKFAPWYNKELRRWIEEQKPTCIFVAPGMPKFLYDIAIKVSKKYKLPMIAYICDDFYFSNTSPKSILEKVQHTLLMKKTRKLFSHTQHIVTICDELSELYSKEFSLPATTIMTGSSYSIAESTKSLSELKKLTYMGNLRYNRYLCLAEIGKALDKINEVEKKDYKLEIYSIEKDVQILSSFDGIKSIKLCGFVSGKEFDKVFDSSEMFIHAEAFDDININLTKRSISTKIADCLGSGIPVFAYGPDCLASINYLKKVESAIIVTDPSQLYQKLYQALNDKELRDEVAKNGLEAAVHYHSSVTQSQRLKKVISEV